MLISEELFLLLTTPKGNPEPWVQNQNIAFGGALLADLITDGQVALDGQKNPHVTLTFKRVGANEHPVIRFGIDALAPRQDSRAANIVNASWFNPRKFIGRHLAGEGIVRTLRELGIERYPTRNDAPRNDLRKRLSDVLRETREPTANDVTLLTLLQQINGLKTIFADAIGKTSTSELRTRIDAINRSTHQSGSQVPDAVKNALDALQTVLASAAAATVL